VQSSWQEVERAPTIFYQPTRFCESNSNSRQRTNVSQMLPSPEKTKRVVVSIRLCGVRSTAVSKDDLETFQKKKRSQDSPRFNVANLWPSNKFSL
jgi:hypothetical protein